MKSFSKAHGANSLSPAPPLWVWGAALALVLSLVLLSIPSFLLFRQHSQQHFLSICRGDIARFGQSRGSAKANLRIVGIGSSLLNSATYPGSLMPAFAVHKGFGAITYLRLIRGAGVLSDFTPVLDQIVAARPGMILIETDSLLYDHSGEWAKIVMDYNIFLKSLIMSPPGPPPGKPASPDTALFPEDPPQKTVTPPAVKRGRLVHALAIPLRTPLKHLDPTDPAINMLIRANNQGIRIVLVRIPRSRDTQRIIPAEHRIREGLIIQEARRLFNAEFIEFKETLDDDCYRDFSHLNEKGREIFSNWLLTEINKISRKGNAE